MVDGWVPKGDAEAGRAPNTYQPPPQQMAGPPSYHTYEAPMQGVQFSQSPLPPSGAPPPPSYHT
ncbi:hypothetical protein T484DRAFT_1843190 [Baffinella frigidus]|nr:hypothetical protein T484DRAFT_1843190 [Cryptophyta sp. CCMP2293]